MQCPNHEKISSINQFSKKGSRDDQLHKICNFTSFLKNLWNGVNWKNVALFFDKTIIHTNTTMMFSMSDLSKILACMSHNPPEKIEY